MTMEIRPVRTGEHDAAWEVLRELRTHLTREAFEKALALQGDVHSYTLIGAFEDGRVAGVLGMRIVHTFARGAHLHVDDLVVTAGERGHGVGRRLLDFAENYARERKLTQVFLDSRPGAVGFYERRGYRRHESTLIKKPLDDRES